MTVIPFLDGLKGGEHAKGALQTLTNEEIRRDAIFFRWITFDIIAILILFPVVVMISIGLNVVGYFALISCALLLVIFVGYVLVPDIRARGPVSVRLYPTRVERLAGSVVRSKLSFGDSTTVRVYLGDGHEMKGDEDVVTVETLRVEDIAPDGIIGFTVYDELHQVHVLEEMGWPTEGVGTMWTHLIGIIKRYSMTVQVAGRRGIPGEALDPDQYT